MAGGGGERDNLPAELTSLIGRRTESAEVRQLLAQARLVTLSGVGGVGKTRLALTVARRLRRVFADGTWFAGLGDLGDPELLTLTVLKVVRPQSRADNPLDRLVADLGHKHVLIVLDNCEHLIEECARLATTVLRECPHVRILATSREPLRVAGEIVSPVPPLSLPDPEFGATGDVRSDAVRLFVERASAADPGFALTDDNRDDVADLCRRLDGLPLALELAAVRSRALPLQELLVRHNDRFRILTHGSRSAPPRHQTLRAAIDWSYELCSPAERVLWARLAVFAGAFDLKSAENVGSGGELARADVLTTLAALVDKSIINHDGSGYRMLDTIRAYGLERLSRRGEDRAVRGAHRDNYAQLADDVQRRWFGPDQITLLGGLSQQHANLRVALDFCLSAPGEQRTGQQMAGDLWAYWIGAGAQREGRHWLDRLLVADQRPSRERAAALWVNAYLATVSGDLTIGMDLLDECHKLASEIGDEPVLAHATYVRGLAELFRGKEDAAVAYFEESVALERAVPGFNPHLILAMANLGLAACSGESADRAIEVLAECRAKCDRHGEQWMMSWAVLYLGLAHWVRGESSEAAVHLRHALRNKRALGDLLGAGVAVEVLAWAELSGGDAKGAADLLGASQALWEPLGEHMAGFVRLQQWSAECGQRAREKLGERAFNDAVSWGRALMPAAAIAYALGESRMSLDKPTATDRVSTLTRRETEVARLVAEGMTNREIAETLIISSRTVDTHVEHILAKLGFTTRTQIAKWLVNSDDG